MNVSSTTEGNLDADAIVTQKSNYTENLWNQTHNALELFLENTTATMEPNSTESYYSNEGETRNYQALFIIYATIGTIGVLGNSFVIVVIFNYTSMRNKIANFFIINQSIIDLFSSVFLIGFTIDQLAGSTIFEGLEGEIKCRLWTSQAMLWSCFTSSTYNLIALTIERYIAIVHPIFHKNAFTKVKAIICITIVWFLGPAIIISIKIATSRVIGGNCMHSMFWPTVGVQMFVGVLMFVLQYLLPILVMIYCYGKMALVLKRRVQTVAPNSSQNDSKAAPTSQGTGAQSQPKNNMLNRARTNIIKTLMIVCACFILCWTSNQFFFLVFNLGVAVDLDGIFSYFSVLAVFVNCCINPFIYITKYESFQQGVRQLFCKRTTGDSNTETSTVT